MCDLIKEYKGKYFIGWKVVVENKGEPGIYYSPATGCKYPKNGNIRPVKEQKELCCHFHPGILDPYSKVFRSNMVGRTAIFQHKLAAYNLCWQLNMDLKKYISYLKAKNNKQYQIAKNRQVKVKKVRITKA